MSSQPEALKQRMNSFIQEAFLIGEKKMEELREASVPDSKWTFIITNPDLAGDMASFGLFYYNYEAWKEAVTDFIKRCVQLPPKLSQTCRLEVLDGSDIRRMKRLFQKRIQMADDGFMKAHERRMAASIAA